MVRQDDTLYVDTTRIILILLLSAACLSLFAALYPLYGSRINTLFSLPALVVAAMMGLRSGIGTWAFGLMAQVALLTLKGKSEPEELFDKGGLFGSALMLGCVVLVGRMGERKRCAEAEIVRREQAVYALNEKKRFATRINQTVPETIFIYDLTSSSLTYMNHALPSLPEYTPEKLKTGGMMLFGALIHPEDMAHLNALNARFGTLAEGEALEVEFRVQSAENGWRWLSACESVFARAEDGSPTHLIGTVRDITDAKMAAAVRLEQEKRSVAQEKERELYTLKSRLMTTISHEFRTPLSIILASGELLERYFDRLSPERRNECVVAIKTQLMHLREMLDDIQLVLTQEQSPLLFQPVSLDLPAFCATVSAETQASISSSHSITFSTAGDWQPVLADPQLLRPIVSHLLLNAVKYSPPGSTIGFKLLREGDKAVIQVSDSGIGIPQEEQNRIFDTLYRGSNVSHISGLGLGLKIVRDYVALHNGTVSLDSEIGAGTTFSVRLPVS